MAVVCGAGINAVGVASDGRTHRFPALGSISGDWGGGGQLGERALWHAVRAEDGRGKPTELLPAVLAHYGETSIMKVVEKLHFEEVIFDPHALCPILFEVAGRGDAVAQSLVDRLVEEIVLLSTVSLQKLDLVDEPVDVVLGGGVMTGTGEIVLGPVRAAGAQGGAARPGPGRRPASRGRRRVAGPRHDRRLGRSRAAVAFRVRRSPAGCRQHVGRRGERVIHRPRLRG